MVGTVGIILDLSVFSKCNKCYSRTSVLENVAQAVHQVPFFVVLYGRYSRTLLSPNHPSGQIIIIIIIRGQRVIRGRGTSSGGTPGMVMVMVITNGAQ